MTLYRGKSVEAFIKTFLLNPNIVPESQIENEQAAYKLAHYFLEKIKDDSIAKVKLKPSTKGVKMAYGKSSEPKSDMTIEMSSGLKYRISIKKDTKNSGAVTFTTQNAFDEFIAYMVTDNEVLLKSKTFNLGAVSLFDEKYRDRYLTEISKKQHLVPDDLQQLLIEEFNSNLIPGLYDSVIHSSQENARAFIRWLLEEKRSIFNELVSEVLSGALKYGDTDAAADYVLNIEGFFTIEEYVSIYIKAKIERGTDIARVKRIPRASKYNKKLSISENAKRFANVAASLSF